MAKTGQIKGYRVHLRIFVPIEGGGARDLVVERISAIRDLILRENPDFEVEIGLIAKATTKSLARQQYYSEKPSNNIVLTKRKCMCCGKTFDSTGIGNRLCRGCGSQDISPFDPN